MTAIQKKKPWPTKDAMEQVYREKLWGDNGADFYSGEGSHNSRLVAPYLEAVSTFLKSFNEPVTVCDLGCGDFNIGKQLVAFAKEYVAVDIVPELIACNTKQFQYPNLEFHCLDIAKDPLPKADCVILKQVLQHLSNAEVGQIVEKLSAYKHLVLTEHLPEGEFIPNKDIISGQGIRLRKQSGIDLLAPPFSLAVKEKKQLLKLNNENIGVIVTTLFTI